MQNSKWLLFAGVKISKSSLISPCKLIRLKKIEFSANVLNIESHVEFEFGENMQRT